MDELTQFEISHINYAVKNGYLDDEVGERMLQNPKEARDYINYCDLLS